MLKGKKYWGIACICALICFFIPVSIKANEAVTVTGGESRETATEIEWGNTYTTTNAEGWYKVYAEWDMHFIGAGYDELSSISAYRPDGTSLPGDNYRRYGVWLGESTSYWGSFDDIPGNNFYYFYVRSTKSESCTFMLMPSMTNTESERELIQFNEAYGDLFLRGPEYSYYQFVAASTGNYKIIIIREQCDTQTGLSFHISFKDGTALVNGSIDNEIEELTFPVKQGVTYYLSFGCSFDRYTDIPAQTQFMISNEKLSSITLNEANLSMKVGDQKQLQASVSPITAIDRSISFTTLNPNVAIVTEDGIITAVGSGSTVIRAIANDGSGVYADCSVSVTSVGKNNANNITSAGINNASLIRKVQAAKAKIKSIKYVKSKKMKLNLSGLSDCDGYQIQYGLKKNFKGAKTITKKSSSVTIKKLKAQKKYYVRVRVYKKIAGKTYYGKWSNVRKVKIKK